MNILHVAKLNHSRPNGYTIAINGHYRAQNEFSKDTIQLYDISNKTSISFNQIDLIVFHGIYKYEFIPLQVRCVLAKKPFIIVPHGSLTKTARKTKRVKKSIYEIFIMNYILKKSKAIQFLCEQEQNESSPYNMLNNIIVPNGIKIPKEKTYKKKFSKKIGFLGRYDIYHKGLDILINAIYSERDFIRANNLTFDFYGSDFAGGEKILSEFINQRELYDIVTVHGPVIQQEKWEVLEKFDFFIHTSRFEGLPLAVLEALSKSIPCILSVGTNFSQLVFDNNAGFIFENDNFHYILNEIAEMNIDKYNELAKQSYLLAQEYSWEKIVKRTIIEYRKFV